MLGSHWMILNPCNPFLKKWKSTKTVSTGFLNDATIQIAVERIRSGDTPAFCSDDFKKSQSKGQSSQRLEFNNAKKQKKKTEKSKAEIQQKSQKSLWATGGFWRFSPAVSHWLIDNRLQLERVIVEMQKSKIGYLGFKMREASTQTEKSVLMGSSNWSQSKTMK